MSFRKLDDNGFSIIELSITMIVMGVLAAVTYASFNTSILEYFGLQKQSMNFTDMAVQTQRISNVLRGSTDIVSAGDEDLTVYAYFSPADTYVSKIHYYKNVSKTKLFADVTRMTSNPPVGTEITASKKTFTILDNYSQVNGIKLFTYLDAAGNALTTPISDLQTIKGIRVSLQSPTSQKGVNQSVNTQVSLRNRKTNL
jgi:prepilin-type N-terminal cleavage/methylation domain-containing protein